jgi:uroporphyrinogen decarboxylase
VPLLRGDEPEFSRQLDLLADLKREIGDRVLMTTTIFNAWTTLRQMVSPPKSKHDPPRLEAIRDEATARILGFVEEDLAAVRMAIQNIAGSLKHFARRCIDAGADGVFMSVRDDWIPLSGGPAGLYGDLVRPADLIILKGASGGSFNMLHVCGKAVDFGAFAEYPVHVLNWADRAAGPPIAQACGWVRPAICGGVENLSTLPNGTPADCAAEVADALRQAGDRPIMIAPGCTYDPDTVPGENLLAVREAVRATR